MSEARRTQDSESEKPDLQAIPSPEELASRYFMVGELDEHLQKQPDFINARSNGERVRLLPMMAHTYLTEKIKARVEGYKPVNPVGTIHSVIEKFMADYPPEAPLTAQKLAEKELYLSSYEYEADLHPDAWEVALVGMLIDHAAGLGRQDIVDSGHVLKASYGRAFEIRQMAHSATAGRAIIDNTVQ